MQVGLPALPVYRRIFADALAADGLCVMARGLGLRAVVAKFAKLYTRSPRLVLVLNANGGEEVLIRDAMLADGCRWDALPRIIDADTGAAERRVLYAAGGVAFITARIAIVDLLNARLPRDAIGGLLVLHAHTVSDHSAEAFIVRLMREGNPSAFVKAFSDDPEALSSGFNRIEKVLRYLDTPKLYLWPRFHALVAADLDRHPADVVECAVAMTPLMTTAQRCIVECMDVCLAELKKATRVDVDELTLENGLFESFDALIRRQLEPVWNTVKPRTKAMLADLAALRKLLHYLLRYDAVAFYSYLDLLRVDAVAARQAAATGGTATSIAAVAGDWAFSDAGERLFRAAKARLYTVGGATPAAVEWLQGGDAVSGMHPRMYDAASWARAPTAIQHPVSEDGGGVGGSGGPTAIRTLHIVLEPNPKWAELMEVLQQAQAWLAEQTGAPPSGASVLIAVRDERTAFQLLDVMSRGVTTALQGGLTQWLTKFANRTRNLRRGVLAARAGWVPPEPDTPASALVAAVQDLPAMERDLWLASEYPGWARVGSATAASAVGPAMGAHIATTGRFAGAGTDAVPVEQVVADLEGDATGVVGGQGGAPLVAPIMEAPTVTRGGAAPGQLGPAPVPAPPYVLPEHRLLWRAAAQALYRERAALLAQHQALMSELGVTILPWATVTAAGLQPSILRRVDGEGGDGGAPATSAATTPAPADPPGGGEGEDGSVAILPTAVVMSAVRAAGGVLDTLTVDDGEGLHGLDLHRLTLPQLRQTQAHLRRIQRAQRCGVEEGCGDRGVGGGGGVAAGSSGQDDGGGGELDAGAATQRAVAALVYDTDELCNGGSGVGFGWDAEGGVQEEVGVKGNRKWVPPSPMPSPWPATPATEAPLIVPQVAHDDTDAKVDGEVAEGGGVVGEAGGGAGMAAARGAPSALTGFKRRHSAAQPAKGLGSPAAPAAQAHPSTPHGRGGTHKGTKRARVEAAQAVPVEAAGAGASTRGEQSITVPTSPALVGVGQRGSGSGPGASPPSMSTTFAPLSRDAVVVYPLSRMDARPTLLADLQPSVIVVYDPDPTFAREIEVYKATLASHRPLRIFFLTYTASSEEQRYMSALLKEQQAFKRLINDKAHMAPVAAAAPGEAVPSGLGGLGGGLTTIRKGLTDGWGITLDGARSAAKGGASVLTSLLPGTVRGGSGSRVAAEDGPARPLTVDICCPDRGKRRVIVDMREFRAKLPMRLYHAGLEPIPATLEVGDFVLSPDMCVERKSVPDLFGSFASGRLFSQAEAMVRHYKRPVLCIEFDEDRPFTLQYGGDVPAELEPSNAVSKMVLLTLHFPTLRMLWCRNPLVTATYFASLKQLQDEPDVETAAAVGVPVGGGEVAPAAGGVDAMNYAAMDMLRKLPGVTASNYRALLQHVTTLADIANLPQATLEQVLGIGNGQACYTFLHARHAQAL